MFEADHQADHVYQVDGGGVQAEVVETDVGASNGVIHSINRVRANFLTFLAFSYHDRSQPNQSGFGSNSNMELLDPCAFHLELFSFPALDT